MDTVTRILLAAAAASALTTVLAALLIVAERYLVNYGQCTIDINDGKRKIEVTGGRSLLETLRAEQIFVPSACGGRGTCSFCKLKILSGGGPVGPTEEPLLSEAEKAANVRVSCQCKVRGDLAIEIPENLFNVREYRGVVERITDLTYDIKELRIRLVEPAQIEFTSGQYVQLRAPAYGDNPQPVYRAYSISGAPEDHQAIELIIRLVPEGICTTWVFEHLAEGDEVVFNGPHGDFHLSQSDGPMVWIAGGSGMAPFWSMIRHMKTSNISRPCMFFFGAVSQRDLFLCDELKQLERELDWFRYVPALSGDIAPEDWSGERGLITEVVSRHIENPSQTEAYLCGSPGMIDASIAVLREAGVKDEWIFFDKFS